MSASLLCFAIAAKHALRVAVKVALLIQRLLEPQARAMDSDLGRGHGAIAYLGDLFRRKAFKIMQRAQLITTYVALIFLPLIFIFSHLIIRLACGGEYPQAVLSLQLVLIGVFFVSANAFRVQFLLVCGKTHIYSRIHIVMAMIGLPLIFLLIYSFSYVGAAISTVVIESGIFIITYFTVKKLSFT